MLTLPGLIDPHVHLRTPGQEQKEDFFTGTSAAIAGGYTAVIDMPNNLQPITDVERLNEKREIARRQIVCDIGFHFGTLGDNLTEFKKVEAKVFGLKLYLNQTTGNYLLDESHLGKIFSEWTHKKPILVHAEETTFDKVLEVVKRYPRKVHLCHMSTEYELRRIIEAKEQGLPVTCGVTPHHLFLEKGDEDRLGAFGMMKPSLKPKSDVDFLWKHLVDVDMIESDHAPHTIEEKESSNPPFGVPGLETTLPLLLTAMHNGKLSFKEIERLCFEGPSNLLGIVQENTRVEIDENKEWEIKNENLFTKCKWTPFNNTKVKGKIKSVYIRGTKVFENDIILVKEKFGKLLP